MAQWNLRAQATYSRQCSDAQVDHQNPSEYHSKVELVSPRQLGVQLRLCGEHRRLLGLFYWPCFPIVVGAMLLAAQFVGGAPRQLHRDYFAAYIDVAIVELRWFQVDHDDIEVDLDDID